MGTRSSKYTKSHRLSPDPRVLNDSTLEAVTSLVRLHGTESGKGHPSSRQQRRAALKALRLHIKVNVGRYAPPGRLEPIPPKYPHRTTTHRSSEDVFTRDSRIGRR